MDIEWAIDKDLDFPENIFIVQARPETVWSQRKSKSVIGGKSGYQLLMEQEKDQDTQLMEGLREKASFVTRHLQSFTSCHPWQISAVSVKQ